MNFKMHNSLGVLCLILAIVVSGQAQPAGSNGTTKPSINFAGETLTYEGKVSRLKLSISVADLTFVASQANSAGDLLVKTDATSKGTLLKLFRYSFAQSYQSTIDAHFRILRTTKHDVQKDRVRDGDATFNYTDGKVMYVETDPKDPNRPPRRIASEISSPMHDMISAIYYLRLQPLEVGKRFDLQVSDSGLVYRVPIAVTGRQELKTAIGRINCFKVEPEVFGPGRLIEQKGRMIIWFADDAKHTPVRASIDSQYGKIEIKLKSATK